MNPFQKTLPVVFVLFILAACHKNNGILPLADGTSMGYITQAMQITNGDTQIYRLVYNPNNTIDSVIEEYNCVGGNCKTFAITYFSYSGSYINIFWSTQDYSTTGSNSAPFLAYRVHLIINGMCDTFYSCQQNASSGYSFNFIKYNGTQIDTFFYLSDYRNRWSVSSAYTFTYNSNGDISKNTDQRSVYNFNYDTTHTTQIGDPVMFNQLIVYGIVYTRCAHLTTSANNNAITYTYTFDSKGRIATANETDNNPSDTTTTEYIYQYKD